MSWPAQTRPSSASPAPRRRSTTPKAAYDAAVAGVADAQKQLEAANEAVVDASLDIVKAKAELANDEALKADLEAVDHKASLAAGTTGNEKLVKLNAALRSL